MSEWLTASYGALWRKQSYARGPYKTVRRGHVWFVEDANINNAAHTDLGQVVHTQREVVEGVAWRFNKEDGHA